MRPLFLGFVISISTLAAAGASFTSSVVDTTPTQATISYVPPESTACSVLVSEDAAFGTLVSDTDPTRFSNQDTRPGVTSIGSTRFFVIGKRSADIAIDGRRYSRALKPNTTHYYRITCASSMISGTFTTQNLPFGNTYPDQHYLLLTALEHTTGQPLTHQPSSRTIHKRV